MLGMSASWGERYNVRIMNVDLERAKVYLNGVIRCFVMYYTYWYGRVRPIPTYRVYKFYDKTWNDKGSLSNNFNRASSWNVGKITFFWNKVVRKRTIIISLPQEQLRNLCIQYSKQLMWWLAASILINFCSLGVYFTTIKNMPKFLPHVMYTKSSIFFAWDHTVELTNISSYTVRILTFFGTFKRIVTIKI